MLFNVFDVDIARSYVGNDSGQLKPVLGFTLTYKTTSTPNGALHLPVAEIPHPGRPNPIISWEETYELVPGAVHGNYGVLAIRNQSLVAHSLKLINKRRTSGQGQVVTLANPSDGVLSGFLGDSQTFISIFADGVLGDRLSRVLLRSFQNLKRSDISVVDSGIYLLEAPDFDETFYPHNASFNTKTVATFTQFGLNLNFRLAESVLVEYGLSLDTETQTRYLDAAGKVVSPNFFSWL